MKLYPPTCQFPACQLPRLGLDAEIAHLQDLLNSILKEFEIRLVPLYHVSIVLCLTIVMEKWYDHSVG
jgi:hypothetical protein